MNKFSFEANKLYILECKEENKLAKYDEEVGLFVGNATKLESKTLYQFNYNALQNTYKIKCLYTSKGDSNNISNVLDIKKTIL